MNFGERKGHMNICACPVILYVARLSSGVCARVAPRQKMKSAGRRMNLNMNKGIGEKNEPVLNIIKDGLKCKK
jgi:hypothetical protein